MNSEFDTIGNEHYCMDCGEECFCSQGASDPFACRHLCQMDDYDFYDRDEPEEFDIEDLG